MAIIILEYKYGRDEMKKNFPVFLSEEDSLKRILD